MTLGEKLRTVRQQRGLTQKQVAGERITRNMLSQIENDLAVPSMKTLEYLASVLQVSVGSLLGEEQSGSFVGAKQALKRGDLEKALDFTLKADAHGDERELLLSSIYLQMAAKAFRQEAYGQAQEYAQCVLEHEKKCFYRSVEFRTKALEILVRCELAQGNAAPEHLDGYQEYYQSQGWEANHHMLMAECALNAGNVQTAERAIWAVTALTDQNRPRFLILRGRLAIAQEKYSNAISYLKQAEEMEIRELGTRRELYRLLELVYKDLEDYKSAYEYAAKGREL